MTEKKKTKSKVLVIDSEQKNQRFSFMAGKAKSSKPFSVYVVDDEKNMTRIVHRILETQGYDVTEFNNPLDALDAVKKKAPDLVLSDIRMPQMLGTELLKRIKEFDENICVLMLTAFGSVEGAVEAMETGADNYISKPFQTDDLLVKIEKALERRALIQENVALTEHISGESTSRQLIGHSASMRSIRELVKKVGPADSPALVVGESGTGKELVARAINRASHRNKGRFVPINCAGIPESLMESELFGHEKGAFTGAASRKIGLIELASGGTLFLDEIGEMPVHLQPKLLRVLQEREIQRVGGLEQIPIDVRLIAATNRNLEQMIEEGTFRQDLYYRLNVIRLEIEPLRNRPEDVPPLVEHFVDLISSRLQKGKIGIDNEAVIALKNFNWPGNIRELENIIERMIVLLDGGVITIKDVPPEIRGEKTYREETNDENDGIHIARNLRYREAVEQFERQYLCEALAQCSGTVSKAAELTGISRRNFYDKIEKLSINLKEFQS